MPGAIGIGRGALIDAYGVEHDKAEITAPVDELKGSGNPGTHFFQWQAGTDGQPQLRTDTYQLVEDRRNLRQVAETV